MFKRIRQYLDMPSITPEISPWKTGIYYAVAVYGILALLQPFGIHGVDTIKYVYLIGYAVITFLGVVLPHYILKLIRKDFFENDNWTHGRSIINTTFIIFLIALGNLMYATSYGCTFGWRLVWIVIWQTLLVSVGVVSIKLWMDNKTLKNNLSRAIGLNEHIQKRPSDAVSASNWFVLEGIGKNASFRIDINQLLYIESERNYCRIVYLCDNRQNEYSIRATISSLEEQLHPFSSLIRSHRAFLVNTKNVTNIEGNSAGYRLHLKGIEEEIPVSRSYATSVLDNIENL